MMTVPLKRMWRAWCALIFLCWFTWPLFGALKPEEVPTFKVRAKVSAAPDATSQKTFTFRLGSAAARPATPGEWSEWMLFDQPQVQKNLREYPASYLKSFPIVTRLRVEPVRTFTPVEVEIVFDETQKRVGLKAELFGPNLGILVWRNEQKEPQAATMAEYNRRYWKAISAVQQTRARPRFFPISERFIGGDDDRIAWREGIAELGKAGFNAIMLPPSANTREFLLDSGLSRTAWAVYNPPGYAFDYETNLTSTSLNAWARRQVEPYLKAGYARQDMAAFAMSDEPGWYYPSTFRSLTDSPKALERFRAYLKSQGLEPSELGARHWNEVWPVGQSSATNLPSKTLFYWTMRFFPWDSARHFAASTRALESVFYPKVPILVNWNFFSGRSYVPGPVANNPEKQSPDAAMGGHDWLEFGKMRGCTMLWTEDWFPDSMAYQWSFYCAKLRSAAEKGGVEFGGYIIPRTAGDREDGILQKILCVAGSGGKCLKYFVFGPEYNFPGNCYSENLRVLPKMAEAHAMIAAAEETLWPGRRPKPQVALAMPRSSQFWDATVRAGAKIEDATNIHLNNHTVDYLAEVFDLYLALQHANIPVDFVAEEDLSPTGLKDYRLIYLTAPDLPAASQRGLLQWVRRGGILARSPNAGTLNRYHEPSDIFPEMLDYEEVPRERTMLAGLQSLRPSGKLMDVMGPVDCVGPRSRFAKVRGKALVRFDDGAPAVIQTKLGAGEVLHYTWFPGLSYAASVSGQKDNLPIGFSETLRKWIILPAKLAQIAPPVRTEHAMVETPILLSSAGAAITLLNWTGDSLPNLRVSARLPFTPERVESVKRGPLEFRQKGSSVEFRLPLGAGDIVTVYPKK